MHAYLVSLRRLGYKNSVPISRFNASLVAEELLYLDTKFDERLIRSRRPGFRQFSSEPLKPTPQVTMEFRW